MAISTGSTRPQQDLLDHPAGSDTNPQLLPAGDGPAGDLLAAARRTPEPEIGYYIAPGTGGHGRARADGLLAVIGAFACRVAVFGYDATRHDKFLIMVAARPVLDTLDLLLPRIAVQMESAARAAATAYAEDVLSADLELPPAQLRNARRVPYFRSYLCGFGWGAAERIRGIRAGLIQAGGADLHRTLTGQDRRAEEVYNREFPGSTSTGLRNDRASHLDGFLQGQDAGRAADPGDEYLLQHDLVFAML
jgi:hypothetical protein